MALLYIVYGSARKSYLKILDIIHHQGLCLALGAFPISRIESLYTEACEPSFLRMESVNREANTDTQKVTKISLPLTEPLTSKSPEILFELNQEKNL